MSTAALACTPSARPEPAPPADATHDAAAPPPTDAASAAPTSTAPPPDAAPPAASASASEPAPPASAAPAPVADPKVKVVTIGMHVGGGPFDEATKEPFKKAVEPHFPEFKQCWAKHVTSPPKEIDVGVDLLIEGAGGKPKVSNPRSTLPKSGSAARPADEGGNADGFVPCVVAVFEAVEFPKLDRGRSGVSYSLRFTRR